jgi:hypothetical protein
MAKSRSPPALYRPRRWVARNPLVSEVLEVLTRRYGASARKFRRLFLTSWIVQVESYPPPIVEATIDFLAVGVETKEAVYNPMIPPTGQVTGRLVFARPMFADVPLVPFDERAHFLLFPCSRDHARVKLAYVGPGQILFFQFSRQALC